MLLQAPPTSLLLRCSKLLYGVYSPCKLKNLTLNIVSAGFCLGGAKHKFPGRRNNKSKRSIIKVSLNISGKGGSKCDGGNVNDAKSSKRWVQSKRQWPNKLGVEPGNNNNNDFETYSKGFWVKYWYLL